jgi:predicted amidohydrolase
MIVTAVQLDIAWEDKPATFARVRRLLEANRPERGALVILPEMFSTGFSMNVAGVQEGGERAAENFLKTIAREFEVCALGGVVNIGTDGRGLNQALAFAPDGKELVRYDKIHPFTLGEEGEHYTGGQSVKLFDWQGMSVAPFVCYDLRFPELFRGAARREAQLMVVIANWPLPRESHWATLLQARAIENQAYVVGVNRCGRDPNHSYFGRSLIIDPHGNIVGDAGGAEGTLSATIDRGVVESWRRTFPALRDMRHTTSL